MTIVSLGRLTHRADGSTARRFGAIQSQRLAVLTAHQWLETLLDHRVELAAFQLGSCYQVVVFGQLHLPVAKIIDISN